TSRPAGWEPSGKLDGAKRRRQDRTEERRALGARARHVASLPVGSQPVGAQPAPQGGTADPEPTSGLGQLAVRDLERVEDGLPLALGQPAAVIALRQEHRLAELYGALLQGARAAAECHEPLAQVIAVTGGAISEPFDHATGPLVRVQHPTVRVEHRDPLTER